MPTPRDSPGVSDHVDPQPPTPAEEVARRQRLRLVALAGALAANFDIAHLQSHSSVALPTRLYLERSGGRYFAVYKEDAPANSDTGG